MTDFVIMTFQLFDELQLDRAHGDASRGEFIASLKADPSAVGVIPVNTKVAGIRHTTAIRRAGCNNLLVGMMAPGGEHDWKAAFLNAGGDQIIPRDTPRDLFDQVVEALLRRDRTGENLDVEFSNFRLEHATGMLFFKGRPIPLTPLEKRIVALVVDAMGQPINHERFTQKLDVTYDTFRQLVAKARKKIQDASGGIDFIISEWRVGYRFFAPGYRPRIRKARNGENYTQPVYGLNEIRPVE